MLGSDIPESKGPSRASSRVGSLKVKTPFKIEKEPEIQPTNVSMYASASIAKGDPPARPPEGGPPSVNL